MTNTTTHVPQYQPTGRWVIYSESTTRFARILRNRYWQDAIFKTKGAAEAARNRILSGKQRVSNEGVTDWAIAEEGYFHARIELWETKTNLLSGLPFSQPVNTPLACDPSSETYHCM